MRTSIETPLPELDVLDVQAWRVYWAEIARRIGAAFARSEMRTRALASRAGLLSPAERKNSWQLAELSGAQTPYGFQHLLGRADGDPEELRDRLRAYVTAYLHAPDAVGVIDATGFCKKGMHSAGVARQDSGTAGRIENSQSGVFLTSASHAGHTRLDRELYLPAVWTADRERCRRVGVPEDRTFATKPALARQMLARTRTAGVVMAWLPGDSITGDDRALRPWLEAQRQPYVLAVSGKESVWRQHHHQRISPLLRDLPAEGWARRSAGLGSKGPRWYDWRRVDASTPHPEGWQRWGLIRRSIVEPTERTAYLAYAPATTRLAEMVRVAGMRWTIEERFHTATGEVGLDHYEVRRWTGGYRHITLAMWAQAFLTVVRAATGTAVAPKKGGQGLPKTSLARFKAHRRLRSA